MTTKLSLVGASSTGKTTLLRLLEKQHMDKGDIAFVHEGARQILSEQAPSEPFTLSVQERILERVLENEKLAEAKNPRLIVTDTSALEVMFYTKVAGDEKGAAMLHQKLKDYIPSYTKFLLLNPHDVPFLNDEVRQESKETRDRIHDMLLAFYQENNLPYEIISGTIEERQKKLNTIFQSYSPL